MRANGARGGVAPLTATDVEYCCCFVSAADVRRARDRVATLATAEFMVIVFFVRNVLALMERAFHYPVTPIYLIQSERV